MSDIKDMHSQVKQRKKEELKRLAYSRKINNQYEFLKKWDKGEITGMECCEGIEQEGKVFKIENDLLQLSKMFPLNPQRST